MYQNSSCCVLLLSIYRLLFRCRNLSKSVPTYDELIRISGEANKLGGGVAGLGMLGARGFWSTYTWEHVAAQAGMQLFDDNFEPLLTSDASVKGLETVLALSKNAIEGVSGASWGENRAAWLGGQGDFSDRL